MATWEGSLVPLPWRPVWGLGTLGKAGPPGLGAGLRGCTTQPGAPLLCPPPLGTAASSHLFLGLFLLSTLQESLGPRSRPGHGCLFEMERKKKQREKTQRVVRVCVMSDRALRRECQLGARGLVWRLGTSGDRLLGHRSSLAREGHVCHMSVYPLMTVVSLGPLSSSLSTDILN